ncbi:MAG TPA: sulfatase-like hydrolase/transferase [Clostridiaceae bacterium]|nr:sulfatase-like hydrolase/transferase [Clostridiaceae bacterium]
MININKQNSRPNILLLMADQQKASAAGGVYGNPVVKTPFLDKMAEKGIAFTNAYSNSPICTPSRASIMTGVHPLVHQVTCHQNRAPFNLPQLTEILQRNGYYTAACGHYERSRCLDRGWYEQADFNDSGPLYNAWYNLHQHGRKDVGWSSGGMDVSPEEGHAALLTNRAIIMLDNIQASGLPFFFHVPYIDPHPPYFVPKPYDILYNPEDIELPPMGDGKGRPEWQYKCLEDCGTSKATELDIKKVIATYYGMITYLNHQMMRLYDEMDKRGMLDNTWIIVTSDHGDYTGEKGLFNKTESLYECLLHVPLVIRPPKNISENYPKVIDGLVELVDLFPTILGIAGIKVPEYAQGYDLIKWAMEGAKNELRKYVFAQVGNYHGHLKTTFPGGMPESGRRRGLVQGARSMDFSYIHDPDCGDEAYDLKKDPFELNSLLKINQDVPEELKELKDSIFKWEEECLRLRRELGIIPGDRGFWEGLPFKDSHKKP